MPYKGWFKAFRDYADYLATGEFSSGLAGLLRVANESVPAITSSGAHLESAPGRQAGRAVSLLGDDVPWWRVVHADGVPAT